MSGTWPWRFDVYCVIQNTTSFSRRSCFAPFRSDRSRRVSYTWLLQLAAFKLESFSRCTVLTTHPGNTQTLMYTDLEDSSHSCKAMINFGEPHISPSRDSMYTCPVYIRRPCDRCCSGVWEGPNTAVCIWHWVLPRGHVGDVSDFCRLRVMLGG